jgi:hypothetical protein
LQRWCRSLSSGLVEQEADLAHLKAGLVAFLVFWINIVQALRAHRVAAHPSGLSATLSCISFCGPWQDGPKTRFCDGVRKSVARALARAH